MPNEQNLFTYLMSGKPNFDPFGLRHFVRCSRPILEADANPMVCTGGWRFEAVASMAYRAKIVASPADLSAMSMLVGPAGEGIWLCMTDGTELSCYESHINRC